ncbi:MAG: DUF1269 domain-containing protein [Anaerolineae bacterium]|nr:DUF1269 domain-containing protein [Anaerolineae bacterium]
MMTKSVVGVYNQVEDAEEAIGKLSTSGFPVNQVSIVAHDLESEKQVHGFVTTGDVAKEGAVTGGWVGGLFGLLVGAAFVWVPGFGPLLVAGPFAAALLGGIEGAVAGAAGGGLLGALFGWGISKQHILKYEEVVKGGKYLVIANGTEEQVKKAHEILGQTNTDELNLHT